MLKKNDEFELVITSQGSEGEGIGHFEGMAFFVKGAVTGDRILAGVTKLKKTYGYARLIKILEPSPDRVEAPCPMAARCGGCQLQSLSYEAQLKYKENKVREDLIRLGGIRAERIVCDEPEDAAQSDTAQSDTAQSDTAQSNAAGTHDVSGGPVRFHHIIGMGAPVRYRNKGQFPVGTDRNGKIISGFYAGHTHSIIDTDSCMIEHALTDGIMRAVREYMTEAKVTSYDEETGKGLVRHVLSRIGFTTHEVMVCVVINGKKLPKWELLRDKLESEIERYNAEAEAGHSRNEQCRLETDHSRNEQCGSDADHSRNGQCRLDVIESCSEPTYRLASFSYDINTENTNVIMGNEVVTLFGDGFITDYIGEVKYRISPLSFYQVNPVQTKKLYSTALENAGLTGDEVVWDLYCGIGTISLFLAKNAKKVYGVEIVPQAIEDAKKNAELNGIKNAEFYVGAAEDVLPVAYAKDPSMHADVIVVDPPRKGCDETLLNCMAELAPSKIVYVSCDPATLSRDVRILESKGYSLCEVRPVDMFPFSGHVETVCLMSRKDN